MITTAEVAARLGLTDAEAGAQEQAIGALIDRVLATVGRDLNRYLGPAEERTMVLDGGRHPGLPWLLLPDELAEDTTATVSIRGAVGLPWVELASGEFAVEGRRLTAVLGRFPPGPGTVQVVATVGWDPGEGPEELRHALIELAAGLHRAALSKTDGGMQSETLGDYSYTRAAGAPGSYLGIAGVGDVLARWRRMPV